MDSGSAGEEAALITHITYQSLTTEENACFLRLEDTGIIEHDAGVVWSISVESGRSHFLVKQQNEA